jgi:hypothetical protein
MRPGRFFLESQMRLSDSRPIRTTRKSEIAVHLLAMANGQGGKIQEERGGDGANNPFEKKRLAGFVRMFFFFWREREKKR